MRSLDDVHINQPWLAGSCSLDDIPRNFAHIKVIHVNARDIRARDKLFELSSIAHSTNVDVIAVSESFLTRTDASLYNITGFEHRSLVRATRGGGGVSIFIHNSFSVLASNSYASEDESAQLLLCRIQRRNISCCIAVGVLFAP